MKKFLIVLVILVAVLGLGAWLLKSSDQPVVTNDLSSVPTDSALLKNMQIAGLDPLSAEGTVLHIHEHVDIKINGKQYLIPGQVGIGSTFISPLHTHDSTGVIHVESPVKKDFYLSQFFDEWGVTLTNSCIANYCADQNNKLIYSVNGRPVPDIRKYVLNAHDEIFIWYGPKDQNPNVVASYNFPYGL